MAFQESFRGGSYGVVETNGPFWREHRRFAIHQFRDFGLGKDRMEQRIMLEVEDIFNNCDKTIGEGVDLTDIFDRAVGNVINQMLFGYRFDEVTTFFGTEICQPRILFSDPCRRVPHNSSILQFQ